MWNAFDVLVVMFTIFDEWVMPLVFSENHEAPLFIRALRIVRIVRLGRVQFDFVVRPWFQGLAAAVILFNAYCIGVETDYPDAPLWPYIENILLIFFLVELFGRIMKFKLDFFRDENDFMWNWLDFLIVAIGLFDLWVVPVFLLVAEEMHIQKRQGSMTTFFRMFRLLRIVRLVRLVKFFQPLYTMAQGIVIALQGMMWVFVIIFMVLYSFAIVTTKLIGQKTQNEANDNISPEMAELFATVPKSMYTLFEMISLWSLTRMVPVMNQVGWLRPMFVTFYVYYYWALISILNGVVCQTMLAARTENRKDEKHLFFMDTEIQRRVREDIFAAYGDPKTLALPAAQLEAAIHDDEENRRFIQTDLRIGCSGFRALFETLAMRTYPPADSVTYQDFMNRLPLLYRSMDGLWFLESFRVVKTWGMRMEASVCESYSKASTELWRLKARKYKLMDDIKKAIHAREADLVLAVVRPHSVVAGQRTSAPLTL